MPTKEEIRTHLENTSKRITQIDGASSPFQYLNDRLKFVDENIKEAKDNSKDGDATWMERLAERNGEKKNDLLSAHSILKSKLEERETNPPKGLLNKIIGFFQKLREKSLLSKVNKELDKFQITAEHADALDDAAKEGLDQYGNVKPEMEETLSQEQEKEGPETQEEFLKDVNEKVNDGPEQSENNLENTVPAVTANKEIEGPEAPKAN